MVWRYGVPVHGCNDAGAHGEPVHFAASAPRRKHVIDVVPQLVVEIKECLYKPPRALDRVRMSERRRTSGTKLSLHSLLKP